MRISSRKPIRYRVTPAIKAQEKACRINLFHIRKREKVNPIRRDSNPSLEKVNKSASAIKEKEKVSINRFLKANGLL